MKMKMQFLLSMLMISFEIYGTLFIIRGPSAPLVAPLGGSVVLPCYVETPLATEKLRIVWRRTDSETLVHLYRNGESRPEVQQQDYQDRAHFFTDQIQHGNFSLRLDNLTAEDKGVYRCKVYSQQDSGKTLVELKDVERLLVSGSSRSISAYVGDDVTLNCSVDSHIKPEHIEEVSWRKTDEDGDISVLLYLNNETFPGSSDVQYSDRVEFFTDEIPKGNFSIRLKSVRTEDKGVYMCKVFAGVFSANATVVLVRLGFSVSHIAVLVFCIASGLLICFKTENRVTRRYLQVSLLLCPNITMVLASVTWFVIGGSLSETICCCVLYILNPLRSFWFTPLATDEPDTIVKYIKSPHAGHAVFMAAMYSVLLGEHFKDSNTVTRTVFFCILVLMCLLFITQFSKEKMLSCSGELCRKVYSKVQPLVAACISSLQLGLLLYTCFDFGAVFIITVLPVVPGFRCCFGRTSWIKRLFLCLYPLTWLIMSGTMVCFSMRLLITKKEGAGLVCAAGILQALWVLAFTEVPVHYLNILKRNKFFLFGSAGLVLVNSAALMTEVIINGVKGERLIGDLRVVVFPSEWLFTTLPLLSLSMFAHCKTDGTQSQGDYQPPDSKGTPAPENFSVKVIEKKGESHEMETLGEVAGNLEEQEDENG